MSFFIPGRTACAICERGLEHRWQAARLPDADPQEAPGLVVLARRYVHRSCWDAWSEREPYSAAAMALVARSRESDTAVTPVVEGQGMVWSDVVATRSFRVEDLSALVTFDVPWGDTCRFARWLDRIGATAAADEITVGGQTWRTRRQDEHVEVVRSQANDVIEVVHLRRGRLHVWATLVQRLCERGPASTLAGGE